MTRRGLLFVAAAATLWGTSGMTATVAYGRGIEPLTVAAWRLGVGALALGIAFGFRRQRVAAPGTVTLRELGRGERRRLAVVAAALGVYQVCYFVAVEHAGLTIATLITLGSAPVLVTVGERLLTGRRTPTTTLVGIVVALVGLVALVGAPATVGARVGSGAAFAVGSALGYATMTLVGGAIGGRLGAEKLTIGAFVGAAALLVPFAAVTTGLGVGGDPTVLAALLYLGVVPTAVAYRLFFTGLPTIRASHAGVLVLLEPLVATGLALLLLGERLTVPGWTGAALLVVAVVLVTRTRQ